MKYFYKDTRNKVQGTRKDKSESICTLILVPCSLQLSPYICPFAKIQPQIAMEPQPVINFDNTEYAFAYKSNKELKQARLLFSLMGKSWLVKMGTVLAPPAVKWNLPFVKPLVRSTIFRQFVGGETLEQNADVADKLEKYGVKVILDYGVEGKEGEDNFDHACEEFIRVINYSSTQPNIPFMSIKVTGFARFGLLEKMDAMIHQNKGSLMKRYLQAVDDLDANEREEWHRVRTRMLRICETAARGNVGVFVDAEETWIQDPVDALTILMMDTYNKEKCIVYNTTQHYRHDRLQFLKILLKPLSKENLFLVPNWSVALIWKKKEKELLN
jgi:proline dehydrogenase